MDSPKTELDFQSLPLEEPESGTFATYANVVNIDWTLYDVRLRFAELLNIPGEVDSSWKNQRLILLEKAFVTLPWHQAKYLRDALVNLIASYESVNGELKPISLAPATPLRIEGTSPKA